MSWDEMGVHPDAQDAAQTLYEKEKNRFLTHVENAAREAAEQFESISPTDAEDKDDDDNDKQKELQQPQQQQVV